jgi:hypothetical protein
MLCHILKLYIPISTNHHLGKMEIIFKQFKTQTMKKFLFALMALIVCNTIIAQNHVKFTMSKSPNVTYTVNTTKAYPKTGYPTNSQLVPSTTQAFVPQGQVFDLDKKVPKTEQECLKNSTLTTNTATYKGISNQVYVTNKGKMFIILPNKTGDGYYRKYIK